MTTTNIVRIELDAQEVVELVDDRLAWLAVASADDRHRFVHRFFRRAEPTILIGSACGFIDLKGVDAEEPSQVEPTWAKTQSAFSRFAIPRLGTSVSFAELAAHDPTCEVQLNVDREFVRDLPEASFQPNTLDTWVDGVVYQLRAFGQLSKAESRRMLAKTSTAQLPCIVYQEVTQLKDGRSVSTYLGMALSPEGKLLLPSGARLDKAFTKQVMSMTSEQPTHLLNEKGECVHPLQDRFEFFVCRQWLRRSEWTVELALCESRTGIGLKTDAMGAREFVHAMRLDGSCKASRRKALVHWVNEHMRRRRDGSESKVRAHLRGVQDVPAGDYHAKIYPSREAIEAACNGERFDAPSS